MTTQNSINRPAGSTTVDFGTGNTDKTVAVTGQGAIQSGSVVHCTVGVRSSSNHTDDEHWVEALDVRAGRIIAGTGFTIYAKTNNFPLMGVYNIDWSWM